jgi:hypothetical protein
LRNTPIYVDDKVLPVPHLVEEGYDLAIVAFEKSIDLAEEREIYRKEPLPPILHIIGDWSLPYNYVGDPSKIIDTLMTGGDPLYKADCLLLNYHTVVEVDTMTKSEFYDYLRQLEKEVVSRGARHGQGFRKITDQIWAGGLRKVYGSIFAKQDPITVADPDDTIAAEVKTEPQVKPVGARVTTDDPKKEETNNGGKTK